MLVFRGNEQNCEGTSDVVEKLAQSAGAYDESVSC